MLAINDAYTLGKRLHRDVSVGNVILVREGSGTSRKGYLIDWDASCEIDDSGASVEARRVVSTCRGRVLKVLTRRRLLTGDMGVHVQGCVVPRRADKETYVAGRYGVFALCRSLL